MNLVPVIPLAGFPDKEACLLFFTTVLEGCLAIGQPILGIMVTDLIRWEEKQDFGAMHRILYQELLVSYKITKRHLRDGGAIVMSDYP